MGGNSIVAGRYRLGEVLGEGGQATVHRAVDAHTGRHVAIKILGGQLALDETAMARVIREQQAMVALAGTNAVEFIDLCTEPDGTLCIVMELLEGRDLEARLSELAQVRGLLPVREIIQIMEPLVETLDKAHSVGIVHRDLKPSNIFLLSERLGGGSRLLDFGLANLSTSEPLTRAGTIMGSPSYIAPESWAGVPGRSGKKADVYSLGVILFRMLGGCMPFVGKTLLEKMRNATSAERPSLHQLRNELPPQVDIWVERALAVDPQERFSSAGACFGELLWALRLAAHPSEQERRRLSEADASQLRSWLEKDAPRFSSPPPVSIQPVPLSSQSPLATTESRAADDGVASDAPPASEDLPFLSVEPVAISEVPEHTSAGAKPRAVLPPIPRAPALPDKETSSTFVHAAAPSTRAPQVVPEHSGMRSSTSNDGWDAATTFYSPQAVPGAVKK
jgi:serine/threonine-protein kinase